MAISLSLNVNGKPVSTEVEPRMLLVQLLREHLHLTGTHVGCDTGQCGACTVHLNGRAVKSCTLLALQAQGAEVTTIEGVAPGGGDLHPMQAAFRQHHGLQCGFCTPGMVMNAIDLVRSQPNLTEADVRNGLDGNLCRCTGYHNIVKAVLSGASAMKGKP
ncbi:MAG: 2Fe-2S iron-sulfur cluster binding domain-containing protein [Betaproteobacteria bacterium]|nr:2Fe-2S iron-sulfur cluster binding domain-containing protein [Betaproteobacteria bacterium]